MHKLRFGKSKRSAKITLLQNRFSILETYTFRASYQKPGFSLAKHPRAKRNKSALINHWVKRAKKPGFYSDAKYAERYAAGTNIIMLAPDVAEVFSDSESVNEALRALIRIARKTSPEKEAA